MQSKTILSSLLDTLYCSHTCSFVMANLTCKNTVYSRALAIVRELYQKKQHILSGLYFTHSLALLHCPPMFNILGVLCNINDQRVPVTGECRYMKLN